MSKKITLQQIKELMSKTNPNIQILDEYEKEMGKTKKRIKRFINCRCLIDGCLWSPELSNLKTGQGCPKCGKVSMAEKQSFKFEDVVKTLKKTHPTIKLLSTEYVSAKRNLKCECLIDGHVWHPSYDSLQHGNGCPKCGGKAIPTLEEIIEKLKEVNPNVKILSTEYVHSHAPLDCECLIDGHVWHPNWTNLMQGFGCPICNFRNRSGENAYNWKGGVSCLYDYTRVKILQWKYDSFNKYNSKCDITGERKDCIVHHLHNFSDIFQETMETLKLPIYKTTGEYTGEELKSIVDLCLELHYHYGLGVCLCKEEHIRFHSIYKYKNNTKEQYKEFKATRKR